MKTERRSKMQTNLPINADESTPRKVQAPALQLSLTALTGLSQHEQDLKGQVSDRQKNVSGLRSEIAKLETELRGKQEAKAYVLAGATSARLTGNAGRLQREIEDLEEELAVANRRLDINVGLAACWEARLAEFDAQYGDALATYRNVERFL